MPRQTSPTTVEVNGYAVREWRMQRGLDMNDLAAALDVGRPYVNKIELGHSVRVSPKVFAALVECLGVQDRRALMTNPHTATPVAEVA